MKKMFAAILAPVVLLLSEENQAIPVNSDEGKKIAAVFEAIKEKKPIPYSFTTYIDGYFFGNVLSTNEGRSDRASIELFSHNNEGNMRFYYAISDEITDGAYHLIVY